MARYLTPILMLYHNSVPTPIYTLSLHDALPISIRSHCPCCWTMCCACSPRPKTCRCPRCRSEEHTSELQSRPHLVCRLLLEKKKSLRGRCRLVQLRWCRVPTLEDMRLRGRAHIS